MIFDTLAVLRLRPASGSEWRPVSIEMLKASQANEKKMLLKT